METISYIGAAAAWKAIAYTLTLSIRRLLRMTTKTMRTHTLTDGRKFLEMPGDGCQDCDLLEGELCGEVPWDCATRETIWRAVPVFEYLRVTSPDGRLFTTTCGQGCEDCDACSPQPTLRLCGQLPSCAQWAEGSHMVWRELPQPLWLRLLRRQHERGWSGPAWLTLLAGLSGIAAAYWGPL